MKMMNKRMMNICRGAISSVAGVDNEMMAAVIAMRMNSVGLGADGSGALVDAMLEERAKASEDYVF